ncbi:hypothetical protein QBC32DRAFT_336908 [Pseudoneurospora amorphoporcata]|uniref:Uncharacterized protein n=1 Tax=Pseudoneurospora amorphoporcata TaxID=241081 RepID=A0AAN6SH74_9PEZI|nr:hypothetical protein QBC32DRAFT_336908 [Pseudoneurospora amorphoporcata]
MLVLPFSNPQSLYPKCVPFFFFLLFFFFSPFSAFLTRDRPVSCLWNCPNPFYTSFLNKSLPTSVPLTCPWR